MNFRPFLCLAVFAGILFVSSSVCLASRAESAAQPLYFSLIPKKNIDQQLDDLKPLLELLETKLQRPIKVIRPQSYQSVVEGVLSRSIDFAFLGPASYAMAKVRDSEIEAFACFSKGATPYTPPGSYYLSLLISMRSSGISVLTDLKGATVAFTDPASTSGSLIPSKEFAAEIDGPLEGFFARQVYTGSHDRSIEAVLSGRVDAAFVASARLDEAVRKKLITPDRLSILWQSRPIHYDPFVFRGGLDPALKEQIRRTMLTSDDVLRDMHEKMNIVGIEAVSDLDYQPILDLVKKGNPL